MTPVTTDAHSGMYPDVGVAATRPAIVPEQNPTIDSLRSTR